MLLNKLRGLVGFVGWVGLVGLRKRTGLTGLTGLIGLTLLCASVHARVVILDEFEYSVGREDAASVPLFMQHGWSHAKTQQTHNAHGYLYTVTSIPGYSGAFPGRNSSRVLTLEALPATLGGQTDYYLQLGHGSSAAYDDTIPGNVWIQFWMYPQYYGTQMSRYDNRNKFLYVCNTDYPCHSHLWMMGNGPVAYSPFNSTPLGMPSNGEFFWNLTEAAGVSRIRYAPVAEWDQGKLGPTTLSEWMRPNRWTLVKIHLNTTSTTNNSYEMWLKPLGGAWVKVAEWIAGVTPGFSWTIPSESVGGHRVLRMPTTVGSFTGEESFNYWMYMDDFAMATTEAELPVYGGTPPPPPPPPPASSRCDVNRDSSTNVSDVQLCANQAIQVSACSTGDINQDNQCNVIDVQRVVNAALGGQCVTQ